MKNEQNAPKIRFKGFTDAWEQRTLGEIFKIRNEKNGNMYTRDEVLAVSDTYGCVNQIKFHGRSFAGEDISNYKVVRTGDIVYTKSPLQAKPYGIIKIVGEEVGIISPLYVVNETTDGVEPLFMYYLFDTPERTNNYLNPLVRKGAKNTMNISNDEWLSGTVTISPSEQEQQLIGNFLKSLDHLITLHQRKCETLQKLKKSMLQKMFPKNGSYFPEIRFAGFTDAWEQRELGEIANRITRKNQNLESTLPLTISAQYGLIDQNEFFDKRIASKDVSGYYLLKKGEFAYNKSYSSDAPWGAVKRLDRYENGVLSTLYIVFEIIDSDKTDSDFIVSYYDTDRWHKQVQAIAAEGARNHGLLNISPNDFFETVLTIPKSVEEQQQIGSYFRNLDHLITLHQRKLETLKKLKKAMLQKMFPPAGRAGI